jgi:hypothetical protein
MKKFAYAALIGGMLMTQSCATIFTGTKDRIIVNSVPEGAKVEIDGVSYGKTPVTIPVKRSLNSTTMTLKAEGYETKNIELQQSFNAVSILNLTNLGGWVIDLLTGAVMRYDVKSYNIELDAKKVQTTSNSGNSNE